MGMLPHFKCLADFRGYRFGRCCVISGPMTDDAFDGSEKFDAERAADTLGLTGKLRAFAFARWRGANRVDSARAAGYGGEAATLRSTGSKSDKSPKVQAFLRWAATGKSMLDDPGDLAEIEGKLWTQVRSTDVASQRFAIDQLVRLNVIRPKMDGPAEQHWNAEDALEEIAGISPLVAAVLARQYGLDPPPSGKHCLDSLCSVCLAALIENIQPAYPRSPQADIDEAVAMNGHAETF
jgi:hypothetical protein